jgi:hypothetical protein
MRKLHEIQASLLEAIEAAENGLPYDKEIEGEAEEKLVNYYHAIHSMQGDVLEAEQAIKTAAEFKKRKEAAVAWLEARVVETLRFLGKQKVDRPDCRITMVAGRETMVRVDPKTIPVHYTTTITPEPVITADWKTVEADAKAALATAIEEARSIAKLEGTPEEAAIEAVKAGFKFHGCTFKTGDPSLRYPKLKAGEAGKEE